MMMISKQAFSILYLLASSAEAFQHPVNSATTNLNIAITSKRPYSRTICWSQYENGIGDNDNRKDLNTPRDNNPVPISNRNSRFRRLMKKFKKPLVWMT